MRFVVFAILIASVYSVNQKYQCIRNVLDLGLVSEGRATAVQGAFDVKTLLTQISILPAELQQKITACGLNLEPAKSRCEAVYGKGNCEKTTSASYQTKCEKLFKRVGCCHCAMECPIGYTEDDYHCIKPQQKKTTVYTTKADCQKAVSGVDCEQRGNKFTPVCGIQFKRVGVNHCIPVCPEGWHDEGETCRKPAVYRMAQPFIWEQGDN